MGTRRAISAAELRSDCMTLERAVLSAKLTTKDVLVQHRPGGARNPDKGAHGWLAFYRFLHRTHAKGERDAAPDRAAHARADAEALDALRSEPIRVMTVGGAPDAAPLLVHAKSLDALLQVHALDQQLQYMTTKHAQLAAMKTADAADLMPRVADAISYTYQLLCWIVTTPGPAMPYDVTDDHPEPPEHIRALEPWDVVRIVEAHHKHMLRLHAVSALIDARRQSDDGGTRPSWSMFIATETPAGESTEVTMKHRALNALLAKRWLDNAARTPPPQEPNAAA